MDLGPKMPQRAEFGEVLRRHIQAVRAETRAYIVGGCISLGRACDPAPELVSQYIEVLHGLPAVEQGGNRGCIPTRRNRHVNGKNPAGKGNGAERKEYGR